MEVSIKDLLSFLEIACEMQTIMFSLFFLDFNSYLWKYPCPAFCFIGSQSDRNWLILSLLRNQVSLGLTSIWLGDYHRISGLHISEWNNIKLFADCCQRNYVDTIIKSQGVTASFTFTIVMEVYAKSPNLEDIN